VAQRDRRKAAIVSTVTMEDVYYDPYDRTILADPYPIFRRMRDETPLYYNERYDFYAVSRFDDVRAALLDKETFSNERGVLLDMIQANIEMPPGTLIHESDPSHAIHRQLLSRVFTPKAMAAIEPQVREFCASRLDELVGRHSFDFVTDFAEYVPMRVFGMLLGIPEEDQQRVLEYTEIGMNSEPGKPKVYDDEDFMSGEFYGEFVDERYENPRDDVITRLIMTEFDDEHGVRGTLTREEALTYLSVLAGAGNHTTNRLISWTAKVLADNPDARRELLQNPSLIPNAIEETLRFEPSSTQIARYVACDVEIYGQTVPEGNAMLCLAGSASRDERVFDDPDRFDIHRKIGHQLTFGYGAHFCLGASLARLEGRVALEEVLKRFPEWELDRENCVLGTAPGVRGYASLPVFIP
jgi:cytochrome P450